MFSSTLSYLTSQRTVVVSAYLSRSELLPLDQVTRAPAAGAQTTDAAMGRAWKRRAVYGHSAPDAGGRRAVALVVRDCVH